MNIPASGTLIANEFLRCLVCIMPRKYEGRIILADYERAKLGDTVVLREQRPFAPFNFDPFTNLTDKTRHVILDHPFNVQIAALPSGFSLSIDQFSARYLQVCAGALWDTMASVWPDRATLVNAPMALPVASGPFDCAAICSDPDSGLTIRFVSYYNVASAVQILRFDILCGFTGGNYVLTPREREIVSILVATRARLQRDLEQWRLAA